MSEYSNGVEGFIQADNAGEVSGAMGVTNANEKDPDTNGTSDNDNCETGAGVEPIAIIGMGMRLPGSIHDSEAFWDLLVNKRNGRSRVPEDRYNVDAFYGPGKAGHVCTKYGYFLDDLDLKRLDTSFWSMTKTEVEVVDPQQRLMLEVVYECLENSGTKNRKGKSIGCYVGVFGEDWSDLHAKETQNSGLYRITGHGDFVIANRISYEFGFNGPSMTIRTACSSSLTGLHEACQALYSGECQSAIVGGCNLILNPQMTIAMTEQGVLSPTGMCKSFDIDADGYARAEAISAVHIKKLSDAVRDGDPIRAVIRSTCVNSDGKTSGLSFPNPASHAALIRRSHERAGITDLTKTAMIECHGTGTQVGDRLEATAVASVFGEHGILIGSVKPNLGHSEGASGITSVIKMVLALEKKTISPNINFNVWNSTIPLGKAKLEVPINAMPWPKDRAERVGVNSFGIGGANAHVLMDSAASFGYGPRENQKKGSAHPSLLVFSASHTESMRRSVRDHESYLIKHPGALRDIAYTLGTRREPLRNRTFCITDGSTPFKFAPNRKAGPSPSVVFVFTGQGAQWAQMGKELITGNSVFRKSIRQMDSVLGELSDGPHWRLEDELLKPKDASRLEIAEFSQPCCTAVQVAMVDVFSSWGVVSHGVVGHSSGEIAAAYACGSITAKEAILIAYFRGKVLCSLATPTHGGMAAIGLGRGQVSPYLIEGVIIGCDNSPNSVTLTGDVDKLDAIMKAIQIAHPGVLLRFLRVACAYHSSHMREVEEDYLALLGKSIVARNPAVPFFSSVTGKKFADGTVPGAQYWIQNLVSPVLFYSAINSILSWFTSKVVLLEFGPHSALAGPIRQIIRDRAKRAEYIPTLHRNGHAVVDLLTTAGNLFQANVNLDLGSINAPGHVVTDLPTYPWHYEGKHWAESRLAAGWRLRKFPHHDILGARVMECTDLNPVWRNVLRLDNASWIRDHDISHDIVFPAAAYICMAGEAIRQLTGCSDYSVRLVNISNALIMHESTATEIITHFAPSRLTTSLDSSWFDFSVSSMKGNTWIKHCTGKVRGGSAYITQTRDIDHLPRKVSASLWYRTMKRFGFNYGPRFQGLSEISAHVSDYEAVATISDVVTEKESPYEMHPSTIDLVFQLFSVSSSKGLPRLFNKLMVPVYIEELYIRKPRANIVVRSQTDTTSRGALFGDAMGVSDGELVFKLKNLRLSSLMGTGDADHSDPHAGVELEWKPDLTFVDATTLMRPFPDATESQLMMEELALACMIETSQRLQTKVTKIPHMQKYKSWLFTQEQKSMTGQYAVPNCAAIAHMSSPERLQLIQQVVDRAMKTEMVSIVTAIHRIFENCVEIFEGKADPLWLLMHDDTLSKVYDSGRLREYGDFFELAAHKKPNMRILEIGAGTGATTSKILPCLISSRGTRMYFSYTYTDISAGFFMTAKERFDESDAMMFEILDISKDPTTQGFEEGSYDLIIASNVLHATPSLNVTLRNVRKLLHPTGRLFLEELCPVTKWTNYVAGVLPGWWIGEDDGRPLEPYVSPERWDTELRNAGFLGADAVGYDGHANADIIALPDRAWQRTSTKDFVRDAEKAVPVKRALTILYSGEADKRVQELLTEFRNKGYQVDLCTINDEPPEGQDIVSVLDVHEPFLHNATKEQFRALQGFLSMVEQSGVLWITGAIQVCCHDPRYALIIGMARTIRTELSIDIATLELEHFDPSGWAAVVDVTLQFHNRYRDEHTQPDMEWVFSGSKIQVGRFHWISVSDELKQLEDKASAKQLDIGKPGFLKTLLWKQASLERSNEVDVKIRADVMIAMGIMEGTKVEGAGLGCEASGVVQRVGPGVKDLTVGDRVMLLGSGTFATHLTTSELLCAKMTDDLSFVDGTSMPCVYSTVIHSLIDMARMKKGDTVLIHSACGGVGIAAIQICQMLGAETFCTVGNAEKAAYLMKTFGIARERIFSSRDITFLPDIMRETKGRGVDIVLNSLSGELLHASWKCVADFGVMVEIGKRDFIGGAMLSMDLFEQNRSFVGVDFARLCSDRPAIVADLLRRCMKFYSEGYIKPIAPMKLFDATRVEEAFRYMQKGTHLGKIVVSMPDSSDGLPTTVGQKKLLLRPNVSYLLVGGLGGLGRAVASWMVEHGARHIVFLSRSAGNIVSNDPYIQELEAQGCTVQLFAGSVSSMDDVRTVVRSCGKPIAGVMQAAMVLQDKTLPSMSFEDWQAAVLPKVQGTWNIHNALLGQEEPLDFFVLFSSWSGLVGQFGQANYAAANTFLDAFTQYRHSLGLPASTLDIGVMKDIGVVSRDAVALEHFRSVATYNLHEQNLLDSLQLMINRSNAPPKSSSAQTEKSYLNHSQVAIGVRSTLPLSMPNNRTVWKRDPRMALYYNLESTDLGTTDTSTNDILKTFLRDAALNPLMLSDADAKLFLAQEIGKTLSSYMLKDETELDLSAAPATLGADSLVSIELKNWFKRKLGLEVTVLEILGSESMMHLGEWSANKLGEKYVGLRAGTLAEIRDEDEK